MNPADTPTCFASHMGSYLCDSSWMGYAVNSAKAGRDAMVACQFRDMEVLNATQVQAPGDFAYQTSDGLAVVSLSGPMSKGGSPKMGGVSTVGARSALRQIREDDSIHAVVLVIDSPGGQAAGTAELANEVSRLRDKKPVYVQAEDMMASAAAWVGLQGSEVAVNPAGRVGSFGTVVVLEDTSEAMEREGVKVHVISTGELKGAFYGGAEITEPQLEYARRVVDDADAMFRAAVQSARGFDDDAIANIWTGETFNSSRALELGIVDAVRSFDETLMAAFESIGRKKRRDRARQILRDGRR